MFVSDNFKNLLNAQSEYLSLKIVFVPKCKHLIHMEARGEWNEELWNRRESVQPL